MSTPIAIGLVVFLAVAGRWGDRTLARARWPWRHPRLGRRTWLALAASGYLSLAAALLLISHDVLEHALMWALHADKAELHEQYAGATPVPISWNGAAVVLVALVLRVGGTAAAETCGVLRRRRAMQAEHRQAEPLQGAEGVRVVRGDRPAAWCYPGHRRGGVFVTDAAVGSLSPVALSALIAHERGHLDGRHHRHVLVADVAAAFAHRWGLLRNLPAQVRLLVELEADDAAIARHGRLALMDALLTIGESQAGRTETLAADGSPLGPRIRRLVDASVGQRRLSWWQRLTARAATAVALAAPAFAVVLPGVLVAGSAH